MLACLLDSDDSLYIAPNKAIQYEYEVSPQIYNSLCFNICTLMSCAKTH